MTEMLQKAIAELNKLSDQEQDQYAARILKSLVSDAEEAAWEEAVLTQALGDALRSDGSLDFDKLRATGTVLTLDELYPEGDQDDEM